MSYRVEKEHLIADINRLSRLIVDLFTKLEDGIIIDSTPFAIPRTHLKNDESTRLIARFAASMVLNHPDHPIPNPMVDVLETMINPNLTVWMHEDEISEIFDLTREELNFDRKEGILSYHKFHSGYYYHWTQIQDMNGYPVK